MKRFGKKLLTLAGLGVLCSFLSLLFVAFVGGRSDGREIPFPAVLGESGCYMSSSHVAPGSTLNEVGSVSLDGLPRVSFPARPTT